MAKGDKVDGLYFGRRFDGVDLYRFAVPNVRKSPKPFGEAIGPNEEDFWEDPRFMILQKDTGNTYSVAIDVETAGHMYEETDVPVDEEDSPDIDHSTT